MDFQKNRFLIDVYFPACLVKHLIPIWHENLWNLNQNIKTKKIKK